MVAVARVDNKTKWYWEIGSESVLLGQIIPADPVSGEETTLRITHSNSYFPIDHVKIYLRIGDVDQPTDYADLTSHDDWEVMQLIEEIVCVDDVEMHRADATEPFEREQLVPWDGTYESTFVLSPGRQSIEVKFLSAQEYPRSVVINDWVFEVS